MKTKLQLRVLLFIIVFPISLMSQQIQCDWTDYSNWGDSKVNFVASDHLNNSYVGGNYLEIILSGDTFISNSSFNCYISKYNSLGSLSWYKTYEASKRCILQSLFIDSDNNVYSIIEFQGLITIDSITYNAPIYQSNSDFLLQKHNSNGVLQFVKYFKNDKDIEVMSACTDISDNTIIMWEGTDTTFIDNMSVSGNGYCFVAKINKYGVVQWLKNLSENFSCYGNQVMTVDENGSLFFIGNYTDTIIWGNSQIINPNGAFIAKTDSNGVELWAKKLGSGHVQGENISIDKNDNIYCISRGYGWQYFSNTDSANFHSGDYFVTLYDEVGHYKGYKHFHDISIGSFDFNNNQLYICGHKWPLPILYELDTNLNMIDSVYFNTANAGLGIDFDTAGNILLGGSFQDFMQIGSCTLNSVKPHDVCFYVAKIKYSSIVSINNPNSAIDVCFYPNPANSYINIKIAKQSFDDGSVVIYDINGKLILNQSIKTNTAEIDISKFKSGIYFIRLNDGKNIYSQKFIKI